MTKSCVPDPRPGRDPGRGAALALKGGGAHGAFTWGVLDRLLEDELQVDAICGVPLGALIGIMLSQGPVRGGSEDARAAMRQPWRRFAQAHMFSPLQNVPFEHWPWGWDMSNSFVGRGHAHRTGTPTVPRRTPPLEITNGPAPYDREPTPCRRLWGSRQRDLRHTPQGAAMLRPPRIVSCGGEPRAHLEVG
jgi:Patatin-like phospholipase